MRRSELLSSFLAAAVILSGCSRKPGDEEIKKDITERIAADVETQSSQVEVTSQKGKVKLTGKVKSDIAKDEVKKIATEEPEVGSVDDETTVDPAIVAPPLPPPPTFSAAQKIGMFVFPKNSQDRDQQLRDELSCYTAVQGQTGVDPDTTPPTPPTSAEIQAAQQEAADAAPDVKGGRVRGAARGAAGGAAIGAIAGSPGKGAGAGAVAGTMRGGMKQRQANAHIEQQAAQQAATDLQSKYEQSKAAYNQKIDTFRRGFAACMDSRNYSVK
jgi:hypothetical protein